MDGVQGPGMAQQWGLAGGGISTPSLRDKRRQQLPES